MAFVKALEYAYHTCFESTLFLFDSLNTMNFCNDMDNYISWLNLSLAKMCCNVFDKLDAKICWKRKTWNRVAHDLLLVVATIFYLNNNEAIICFMAKGLSHYLIYLYNT